ncbi:hypothetical protein B7494_g2149 [Chlorociboria aeruginascens]|nr:hypothetical protein B7494_g2149 [Chlorociboria aeruginascens]
MKKPTAGMPLKFVSYHVSRRTFKPFPKLPTELRLQIWKFASWAPRTIELNFCIVDEKFIDFGHPPAILHVCRESREVGLSFYSLSFGTTKQPPEIYFNPLTDLVYLGTRQYDDEIDAIIKYFCSGVESGTPHDYIRHLAFSEDHWSCIGLSSHGDVRHRLRKFLRAFLDLETLVLVMKHELVNDAVENPADTYAGISLMEPRGGNSAVQMQNATSSVLSSIHPIRTGYPTIKSHEIPRMVYVEYGMLQGRNSTLGLDDLYI